MEADDDLYHPPNPIVEPDFRPRSSPSLRRACAIRSSPIDRNRRPEIGPVPTARRTSRRRPALVERLANPWDSIVLPINRE